MNPEKLTKITFFLLFLFSINYLPLLSDPILNFYIAQYALTPAIVKKGSEFPYTVGIYDKIVRIDKGLSIYRQLSPDIFVFKRSEK